MERIASFCVDHTRLERGMYIVRGHVISKWGHVISN